MPRSAIIWTRSGELRFKAQVPPHAQHDDLLVGYSPAPHALASTAMHQVVLAFRRFSEFDKFANVSFRTTRSNVYGFSAGYAASVFVFWNGSFLRFWRS